MGELSPEHKNARMVDTQANAIQHSSASGSAALQKIALRPFLVYPVKKTVKTVRRHWIFFIIVILPTLLMAIYLWFIAAPQYISEAHFLVRGKAPSEPSMGGLSSLLTSSHEGSQDTYAVQDYMISRDALHLLTRNYSLKEIFNRPYADFLAKFPSVFTRKDFESFYNYYKRHIKAQIDEETGISHLTVRTFSAEDSQNVARGLLEAGEKLVNDINDRQRYNTLHAAQVELNDSLRELHDTEMKLAAYRYNNEIIDPLKQATPMVGMALSLENTLSMIEAEKKQLEATTPNSPLIKVYTQRISSLRAQMERAQAHILGKKEVSLVPKLSGYDELIVRRNMIEKKISAEAVALETAKAQANRQMLYVTVVSQPSLPDYAVYPRDIIVLLITFFSALSIYITGALLVSGAREHAIQ